MPVSQLAGGLRRCGVARFQVAGEGGPGVHDRAKQGGDILFAALHGERDACCAHANPRGGPAGRRPRPDDNRFRRLGAPLHHDRCGFFRLDAPRQRPPRQLVLRGRDGVLEPVDFVEAVFARMRMRCRHLDSFLPLALGLLDGCEGLQQRRRADLRLGVGALLVHRLKLLVDIRPKLLPEVARGLCLRPPRERGRHLSLGLLQPRDPLVQQLAVGKALAKFAIRLEERIQRANLVFERSHLRADVVEPVLQVEDAIPLRQQLLPAVPGLQNGTDALLPRIREALVLAILRLRPAVCFVPTAESLLDLLGDLPPQGLLVHVGRGINGGLQQVANVPQFACLLLFPDRDERALEFCLSREQDMPKRGLAVHEHLAEPLLHGAGIGDRGRAVAEPAQLDGTPAFLERPACALVFKGERDVGVIAVGQRQPGLHGAVESRSRHVRGREQRMKDRLSQRGLAQLVRSVNHHQRLRQVPGLVYEAAERMQSDRVQPHARDTSSMSRWASVAASG